MIVCNKISKSYGDLKIFDNFSYKFNDTGLYLLYGRSGSGKTTLLNILYGLEPFNNGYIAYSDFGKKCETIPRTKIKIKIIENEVKNPFFLDFAIIPSYTIQVPVLPFKAGNAFSSDVIIATFFIFFTNSTHASTFGFILPSLNSLFSI